MERPFNELHELYRILFLKAEAQAKADKEKKEKEEAELKKKEETNKPKGIPSYYNSRRPADINKRLREEAMAKRESENSQNNNDMDISTPSPMEAEALQDALEELTEGGVF